MLAIPHILTMHIGEIPSESEQTQDHVETGKSIFITYTVFNCFSTAWCKIDIKIVKGLMFFTFENRGSVDESDRTF